MGKSHQRNNQTTSFKVDMHLDRSRAELRNNDKWYPEQSEIQYLLNLQFPYIITSNTQKTST